MAKTAANTKRTHQADDITALRSENKRLKQELAELQAKKLATKQRRHLWRSILTGVSATLAVVLFMLFNLSFWAQRTVVNNDQFVATVSPIIRDPEVQKALQTRISDRIFSRIDVESRLKQALPENLDFIAAPFANQVKSFTTDKIGTALQSEQVANAWTVVLGTTHQKLMDYINNPNYDGTITVDDVYSVVGAQLQNSQIGFLFGKDLPDSIGSVTIRQITWLPKARQALDLLNKLTVQLAIGTVVFAALAIGFSKRRLPMVAGLLIFSTLFMLVTLLAIRIGQSASGTNVAAEYRAAVQAIYRIVSAPLVAQTQAFAALFGAALLIMLASSSVSWVTFIKTKLRNGLDAVWRKIVKDMSSPAWLEWIAHNHQVIGWTLIAVLFVLFALRMPPTTQGVITALGTSLVSVVILELAASLNRVTAKNV